MSQLAVACPACGGQDLQLFYEVHQVPAHSCLMLPTRAAAQAFPKGDLELVVCRACTFVFNRRYDATLQNYSPDYEETQAFSPRFRRFLDEIWADHIDRYALAGKTVLEIGCGKGEFLVGLCERAPCRGIGIDPGYRPERTDSAAAERIRFIQDFYGPAWAHLQADYVCCRHTLEHVGPVADFLGLVRATIGERLETDVFFDLPDLRRVLLEQAFWDIYYEHCSYFTAGSLASLFRRQGFDVHRLYRAYDEQYLMLEARPAAGPTVARLPLEQDREETLALIERFAGAVARRIDGLRADIARWLEEGRRIAIWGSGSKAVACLTTLGLGAEISAVVDINPHKWGRFLAGTGHEIVSPRALAELRPGVVLVMNPIYTEEIGAELAAMGLAPELVPLR